ncbi:acyltransferase [Shewanella frigidimarina]|uniref:acyltransferase n=1 Tax=Shewanella frigidimarina TaxID=56812 RepID=UPI003FA0C2E0
MGRFIFKYFSFIIDFLSFTIKFFPLSVKIVIYSFFSNFPSKLGVLFRYILLKSMCKKMGVNVYISRYVILKNIENISFGDNVSIHEFSYVDGLGGVFIGDNVSIAHNSSIISFEHTYGELDIPIKYNSIKNKSIEIASDVWVGCGVRILGGTQIGSRTIIAAGSVVKGNLSNNSIYAGIPANFKKSI